RNKRPEDHHNEDHRWPVPCASRRGKPVTLEKRIDRSGTPFPAPIAPRSRSARRFFVNMNNTSLEHLYNCSAQILERNVTLLLRLNRSEFRDFIEEALNKSSRRDVLRDALSDCIFVNQERPFDLHWWQKLLWALIFAVILLVATGGNIIVMWIVL
ncbi:hypothetical protein HN011_012265, partial [Eciton burchellii]